MVAATSTPGRRHRRHRQRRRSAVMLEVIRVLRALNLKLDRTVRIGLWGGEEEGLFGSREYVKKTFADPPRWRPRPSGTSSRPITTSITAPARSAASTCRAMRWSAVLRSHVGAVQGHGRLRHHHPQHRRHDHQSFDAVGLPGFQFIQDPLEYGTRTHHSNMDVYDRVVRGDLMQMSVVVSSLVYHTANREQKLPRKPKPAARPALRPCSDRIAAESD